MRRGECSQDILSRAATRIDESGPFQFFERSAIRLRSFTLDVGRVGAANVWSFIQLESEPTQVLVHGRDKFRAAAGAIEIFIAQDERSIVRSRPDLRRPECFRMAEMQVTGRGRRETTAVAGALFVWIQGGEFT